MFLLFQTPGSQSKLCWCHQREQVMSYSLKETEHAGKKIKLHQHKRKSTNFPKLFGSTDCYRKKNNKKKKLFWLVSLLETQHSFLLCFLLVSLAGLEGDLQDFVSQSVPIQTVDRHGGLLVVRHGNEAETFALVGIEVSDHLHIDDGTEGPEHLPQDGLVRILTQIIDKDAPTAGWVPRNSAPTAHVVNAHWRKSGGKCEVSWKLLSIISVSDYFGYRKQ